MPQNKAAVGGNLISDYNTSSNKPVVPAARAALDKVKMEAAAEVGVNLKKGYNDDLTSRQAGSVDGQMVKNVTPNRILKPIRANRCAAMHYRFITNLLLYKMLDFYQTEKT